MTQDTQGARLVAPYAPSDRVTVSPTSGLPTLSDSCPLPTRYEDGQPVFFTPESMRSHQTDVCRLSLRDFGKEWSIVLHIAKGWKHGDKEFRVLQWLNANLPGWQLVGMTVDEPGSTTLTGLFDSMPIEVEGGATLFKSPVTETYVSIA